MWVASDDELDDPIIAGTIDQMGLEERVNNCLGTHAQQIVSPGQGLKAMILDLSAPLLILLPLGIGAPEVSPWLCAGNGLTLAIAQ